MKETWQVVLAGEGGQGLILAGILLARAAATREGKNATQTQSYGIASRGGFSKSEVVISTKEIIYPGVEEPDIVLALTPEAYEIYAPALKEDAYLIYDTSLIPEASPTKAKLYGFPFTDAARRLGHVEVANIISLGTIAALTGVVGVEELEETILEQFSGKAELNREAYRQGVAFAKENRGA